MTEEESVFTAVKAAAMICGAAAAIGLTLFDAGHAGKVITFPSTFSMECVKIC
jgi:hypothetical protein